MTHPIYTESALAKLSLEGDSTAVTSSRKGIEEAMIEKELV
jgi:hypothetical protein